MNIYRKQMNRLDLSVKQYATLLGVPYEIVKQYVNGKVDDSMKFKSFFDKKMIEQRDFLENNIEQTAIQALNIKMNSDSEQWYNNEYNYKKFIKQFGGYRKFYSMYMFEDNDGNELGYYCVYYVVSKCNRKHADKKIRNAIIDTLYEINKDNKTHRRVESVDCKDKVNDKGAIMYNRSLSLKIAQWYNDFDLNDYLDKKQLTLSQFALQNKGKISYGSMYGIAKKSKSITMGTKIKLYNIVTKDDQIADQTNESIKQDSVNDNQLSNNEQHTITVCANAINLIGNNEVNKKNDDLSIYREIIKDSLSDREKALIRLFGGNI